MKEVLALAGTLRGGMAAQWERFHSVMNVHRFLSQQPNLKNKVKIILVWFLPSIYKQAPQALEKPTQQPTTAATPRALQLCGLKTDIHNGK